MATAAAADKPGDANSETGGPATATAPATAGQYTQQAAGGSPSTSTNTTTEVTANAAAQAQSQSSSTQQSGDLKLTAKPDDAAKQPVAASASDAPKSTAATQPPAQGTAQGVGSPAAAHQPTGTGAHTGNGAGSHSGTPGQPGPGTAGAATASTGGGSQSASVFTMGAATQGGSSGNTQPLSAPASHELVRSAVTMQEAVDAVKATFTAANQAGISSARITLSPESLGGIKISLSQTPDGLIARVATDHPEAAMTLQQSAGDLKRSLEQNGMSLLRLDIGSSGQQSQSGFAGSAGNGSQTGTGWSSGTAAGGIEDDTTTPTELTVELSNGSLVNVLA